MERSHSPRDFPLKLAKAPDAPLPLSVLPLMATIAMAWTGCGVGHGICTFFRQLSGQPVEEQVVAPIGNVIFRGGL